MLCHQHTQGSFIMLQRGPRPLSNPHYIWANVGNEDVWVIKHHCGPSLYKKRNTLSGIVLHLKDKCIGQKISPILVTVPYYAPCSTVSTVHIFAARWQPWCSTRFCIINVLILLFLLFFVFFKFCSLGSIHCWVLTKWTTKNIYMSVH